MHIALQTDEVLRLLFGFLSWHLGTREPGYYDMRVYKRSLLNAAVTTHFWTDVALDVLWAGFVHDVALLKLLGVFKDGELCRIGKASDQRWERFLFYARKAARIIIRPTPAKYIDEAYRTLSLGPGAQYPRLGTVLCHETDLHLQRLAPWIGPHVHTLILMSESVQVSITPRLQDLLRDGAPCLRTVKLLNRSGWATESVRLALHERDLHTVVAHVPSITLPLLITLSSMRHLRFCIINATSLSMWSDYGDEGHPTSSTSLKLCYREGSIPGMEDQITSSQHISTLFTHLTSLRLNVACSTLGCCIFALSWISPLLSLVNIEDFELHHSHPPTLDTGLGNILDVWGPKLRTFIVLPQDFMSGGCRSEVIRETCTSAFELSNDFATKCPNLKHLGLSFGGRVPEGGYPFRKLETLEVAPVETVNPEEVARFLRSVTTARVKLAPSVPFLTVQKLRSWEAVVRLMEEQDKATLSG